MRHLGLWSGIELPSNYTYRENQGVYMYICYYVYVSVYTFVAYMYSTCMNLWRERKGKQGFNNYSSFTEEI
jgi:hypothetical protein